MGSSVGMSLLPAWLRAASENRVFSGAGVGTRPSYPVPAGGALPGGPMRGDRARLGVGYGGC